MKLLRIAVLAVFVLLAAGAALLFLDSEQGGGMPLPGAEAPALAGRPADGAGAPPFAEESSPDAETAAGVRREEVVLTESGEVADLPPAALLTAEVKVRIETQAGGPIAGAEVLLQAGVGESDRIPVPFRDFELKETSDAGGGVAFKVPCVSVFTVSARCAGFAPGRMSPILPGDDVVLRMEAGHDLIGRLVDDESGSPVACASVRVERAGEEAAVESDAGGRFRVADLAAETYRVEILAEGYDVLGLNGVLVGEAGGDAGEVRLARGASLGGAVKDASSGAPIPGATVEAAAERREDGEIVTYLQQSALTDAEGRFTLDAVSRSGVSLSARAAGYAASREPLQAPEDENEEIVIELRRGATVSGIVTGPAGEPLAGAAVRLLGLERDAVEEETVSTDAGGRFVFNAVAPWQKFDLVAAAAESGHAPGTVEGLAVDEGKSLEDVAIALQPGGTVKGVVVDALGAPAPYAWVLIDGLDARVWKVLEESPLTYTGDAGTFELKGLPAALLTVSARSGEFYSAGAQVTVIPGGVHELTLALLQGQVIRGIVTDPSGAPLADALVTAFAMDPDFAMPEVPRALRAGEGAQPGRERRPGDRAGRGGERKGEREQDRRAERAQEQLSRFARRVDPTRLFRAATGGRNRMLTAFRALDRTAEDGLFQLVGLDEGESLALAVRLDGHESAQRLGVSPGGPELRIVLAPLLTLAGSVVDERTRLPIPSFHVTAAPVGDEARAADLPGLLSLRREVSRSFRSQDGSFVLAELRPGRYEVTASAAGYKTPQPRPVALGGAGVATLLIELKPASVVEGRVLATDGSAVAGAPVFLRRASGGVSRLKTSGPEGGDAAAGRDESGQQKPGGGRQAADKVLRRITNGRGEYSFRDVKPGAYDIGVGNAAEPAAGPFQILVEEGGRVLQDFRVDAVGDLTVEVSEDRGFRLPKAQVELKREKGGAAYQRRTDDSGRAVFDNVLTGEYQVTVSHKGFQKRVETVRIGHNDRRVESFALAPVQ
ncbi:MAG: carboxypeptidase regulatory-like domain-containing protein [Planctomycetes bacterium]|nr:carboxypeptidase regulatory-like domain-containing protein [Planctomycetota bacterium]